MASHGMRHQVLQQVGPFEVGPEDVACDLGCGLGGWCVEAAKCGGPGDPWLASQEDGPMEPRECQDFAG